MHRDSSLRNLQFSFCNLQFTIAWVQSPSSAVPPARCRVVSSAAKTHHLPRIAGGSALRSTTPYLEHALPCPRRPLRRQSSAGAQQAGRAADDGYARRHADLVDTGEGICQAKIPKTRQCLFRRCEPSGRPGNRRRSFCADFQGSRATDRTISHAHCAEDVLGVDRGLGKSSQRELHRLAHPGQAASPHARRRQRQARRQGRPLGISADRRRWPPFASGNRAQTGRKHQIRLQLADHGQPIVGDRKYGSAVKFPAGIALHARRLVIAHPVRGESLEFLRRCPSTGRGRFSRSGVSPLRECGETPHLLSPARIA